MTDFTAIERLLTETLGLEKRPVAVLYRDTPPAGIAKFEGTVPSGCSFWRLARSGRGFYTVPSDHFNCPIGSYTHNIALPENRANELTDVLKVMTDAGYVRMEEVPGIPRLEKTPACTVYVPLGLTPETPDVVIFAERPGRLMRLQEAALRAGVAASVPVMARPTCAALPAALSGAAASSACIGNRVYTDITDDEIYFMVRGAALERVAAEAATIASANAMLEGYHRERRRTLATV